MSTAPPSAAPFAIRAWRRLWRALRRHPFVALAVVPLILMGLAAAHVASLVPQTPDIGDIRQARAERPSVVLTADGQPLAELRGINRNWVSLGEMSPTIVAALIATEDHRFYEHRGIDLWRTAAAAVHTLAGRLQGGSTITQQLARNLYPEEIGRAPSVERKLKEAITALKIESRYAKDEILESYLNTVPFLYNAYGIDMAARTYFSKPASELDLLEAATLVGMLKGTRYYNPVLSPDRARQRRNVVLGQMVKHGKLEQARFEQLRQQPLRLAFQRPQEQIGPAPHFAQQLRRWLADWAERRGLDPQTDGLVVHTTIDSRLQAMATRALTRQADRLQQAADKTWAPRAAWGANRALVDAFIRESKPFQEARASGLSETQALARLRADTAFMRTLHEGKTRLQAGFVAIEPGSGHVRAWVGSRGFEEDQFDHVQQARRQPGSTFKPFVYGAAFAHGAHPEEMLLDEVLQFPQPDGSVWQPRDVGAPTGLPMTLRQALARSRNTITAQVMHAVGPSSVAQLAYAMGVRDSTLEEVPSLALGTSLVSLKEMVAAYGTIANAGQYVAPSVVTRVEDRDGRVLEEFQPTPAEPVLSAEAALTLLDVLRDAVDEGTARALRTRHGLRGDLAGKTGTTQDNTDGWFILMHPQLVAGAWVGFNDSRITMHDSWGQGARSALPIVGDFYQQAVRARMFDDKARFPEPPRRMPEGGVFNPQMGQPGEAAPGLFPGAAQASGAGAAPAVAGSDTPHYPMAEYEPAAPAQPAVVVAPPRAMPWPSPARPERAIVVAPPRPQPVTPPSAPGFPRDAGAW